MAQSSSTSDASTTHLPSLLIFTGSHHPLPRKYPHPHKPILLIPPFMHRTLHAALDQTPPATSTTSDGTLIIPHPDNIIKHDLPELAADRTGIDEKPHGQTNDASTTLDTAQPLSTVAEDGFSRSDDIDAEVTVKLHLVGSSTSSSTRLEWITKALTSLAEFKGLKEVDTLLLGFKGVDYRGQKSEAATVLGCGTEGMESGSGGEVVDEQVASEVVDTWRALIKAKGASSKGLPNGSSAPDGHSIPTVDLEQAVKHVKILGTLYMPLSLLETLSEDAAQAPTINSMDTPDCHHLPREYLDFARERGIELWAGGGGEGSDPMPDRELHNVLQEFNSSLIPIIPSLSEREPPLLENLIPLREDGLKYDPNVEPDLRVNWVLGYTLVSKTRNVVKDKGYIVSADWVV
ncbi:hypothetical protein BD324DRAFT_166633 [Kockovaella imperatae]|uniref:GCS light chain n=1 Tax=Kockovaella imperatae TaxID=4999 RepID=A0A1Y1U7X6_9TREE|nr:hypothetical protein BD324DRAFT_166633 [Kockovaella imperatae]ORX34140.1 hypothetical protein BD324DRAFT_166633 [Kockovaella imperatae]